ncbi:MAG: hypothetical protein A3F11_11715 [Gammaproteobacteria bacterium RIFCSPHIGHO2_12_FULL_37_14]|nr:MAG: hypothetical protein A3F11_11715 [Gammaproteobacteria bacterium RIFCSPHIGHO2_12_FULL_37_14]
MYHYQAFQLTISSEMMIPELLEFPEKTSGIDVKIQFGIVAVDGLVAPLNKGVFFQVNETMLWLHVPKIARFLVTQGQHITIDPIADADEDSIRIFLLGSCFGALLMQRSLFVLHGSAIQVGNYSFSIAGPSGVGKSTLSGAFLNRGYSILADDICAVNQTGEVLPSFPQIKLWADAAKKLKIDTSSLKKIRPSIEKYALPLDSHFQPAPLALKMIYILNSHNKSELNIMNLTGAKKLQPLRNQLYRLNYLKNIVQESVTLQQCGFIANRVGLVKISRPESGFSLDKLVNSIEGDLINRGFIVI